MIDDPNLELLTLVADALGELRNDLVFVGGCATGLLLTDPGAAPVRMTQDVDAIVEAVSLREYHALGDSLREKGFDQTLEEADPPYRWTLGTDIKLDLMPLDERVLGFSNRWYELALRSADEVALREGLVIRVVTPPYFVATKLEAFLDRGKGDFLSSHDLEDVLSVVDGRPELVDDIARAQREVREFIAATFERLLANDDFLNALSGLISDRTPQTRTPIVQARLQKVVQNERS